MYVLLSVLKIVNLTCIDAKHLEQNKQRLKKKQQHRTRFLHKISCFIRKFHDLTCP